MFPKLEQLSWREKTPKEKNLKSDAWLKSQRGQQFEMLLHDAEIVSFDLFDTLIQRERLFSPKDLFYRVQEDAERRLGLQLDDFATVRVRAEEIARVRAWGRGVEEVTLNEIYSELERMTNLEPAASQNLKELELDCERSCLTALRSGLRLFKAARAAGKTVVIITDTYFDEDFVIEIVNQNGYGDAHKVYVSSAYGKTKVEGSLYSLILKELGCTPNKWLHVGDNQLSDITISLNKGMRAFFVPTPKQRLKWFHGVSDRPSGNLVISAMLCNLSQKSGETNHHLQSVLTQTATQNLSLLYFGYSTWLLEQLREGGYKRVYFAARDGLIMKRFFDLVATRSDFEIDSRYLYVSRAALYPSLIFTDPPMARRLFSHYWDYLTLEDALRRISLTFEECASQLVKHKLADRKLRMNNLAVTRLVAFLEDVWPLLERKYEERYQLMVKYLHQEMFLTEEKAAFVDIGWHGSLQNCLLKLLNHLRIAKDLGGYYLGTFEKPLEGTPDFRTLGFLVNQGEPHSIYNLVRSGPSLLELFHSAGHGSVLGYQPCAAEIVPVLEDNPEEQQQYQKMIKPVQEQAFEFVAAHLERSSGVALKPPDPGLVARLALRVIYSPTAAESAHFGRLAIASDFGGRMKSITGVMEWDLKKIKGETLPDGTLPIWRPGFEVLRSL
jgi:predicted HAD superfamily hydrolase